MTTNDAMERETQPESTNMPINWPGQRHYQLKLRQGRVYRERTSICILWERSRSAFGFEFLLQLDEAPA
ncbi:uncharacterized protein N7518_006993 [Penicillium psychrosexuale]|uniref:uncharacterized protein n=1 Tax=Penicillium psychrosexuale TaxID=1002107 RepID=UPI0025454C24|nr:uncharacterized protein N7518_006993 [Penicillium psychrosexuale]KAJ5789982.1 hypothetical protein N7518_006993 [Penicillium psychrosexuale]